MQSEICGGLIQVIIYDTTMTNWIDSPNDSTIYAQDLIWNIAWFMNYVLSFETVDQHKYFGSVNNKICASEQCVDESTSNVIDFEPIILVIGTGLALSWIMWQIGYLVRNIHGYVNILR